MSDLAISVEKLSKSYRLGQIGTGTLTNDLKVWWARRRGQPNPLLKIGQADHGNRDGEELWALRDVSFTVEQGEVLGIIGRNGAGKSTLLKILSRVTAPTAGCVKVRGRIASLLEVGTGFHPELTGRENIYLNGAILGMSRDEVRRKFDEIVAFAEVEKFIDTPVKRYSSGMYVRLAFAVAAHLESEILLVDEVLAVGDAEFQKKCLGKMGDVASNEGRTVLFVSHNMAAVQNLCKDTLCIKKGAIDFRGNTGQAITCYLMDNSISKEYSELDDKHHLGDGRVKITSIELYNVNKEPVSQLISGDDIVIRLNYCLNNLHFIEKLVCIINIKSMFGQPLFSCNTRIQGTYISLSNNRGTICCSIPNLPLNQGRYYLDYFVKHGTDAKEILDGMEQAIILDVKNGDFFKTGHNAHQTSSPLLVKHDWKVIN